MHAYKLKIPVIGPTKIGKSKFVNIFTNQSSKVLTETYSPTVALRILEHDTEINGQSIDKKHNESITARIEFWDVSGDTKYQNGWTAVSKDCVGIIIICNSELMDEADISYWLSENIILYFHPYKHNTLLR
ncbi:hypothetical protein RFI_06138 [Reticulomyxa filosa]|uniref:Uncharacterized protein n=1 Tax=Reticulomyxa filosa TaxID=46433 RepID=X6NYC9_RETFI|nr:hypothetical protein RFI_06138 [Reticulomyxa filosa]|eukprot:ETO30981.1 hypothetical protein RFI_06138 [Reticulomyxa filosa]